MSVCRPPDPEQCEQAQNRHQAAGHEGAGADEAEDEEDEQGQRQGQGDRQAPGLMPGQPPGGDQQAQAAGHAPDEGRTAGGLDEAEDAPDEDEGGVDEDDERSGVHAAIVPGQDASALEDSAARLLVQAGSSRMSSPAGTVRASPHPFSACQA